MTKVLVTGGCGFVGHHLVEHLLKNTDWEVVILDRLNYASSGLDRLRDIHAPGVDVENVPVFAMDLANGVSAGVEYEIGEVDYVLHLAAETHVDNSITHPLTFVRSNVLGTAQLLEWARRRKNLKKFIFMGTDEVFGPAEEGVYYKEWDRYNSTNPYSATKAGAEELCLAWANTYKLPIVIAHTMNCFGERQHPEKFIPMTVRKVLDHETVTIHADKTRTRPGSRFYIHARNTAAALLFLLEHGQVREKYNIVGECEVNNLQVAQLVSRILLGQDLDDYLLVDFHSSRPGHDLRYALDGSKMKELGWDLPKTFHESFEKTILWMANAKNSRWLRPMVSAPVEEYPELLRKG